MKTLKTIILGLVAVITFGAASAKTINPANEKVSVKNAVAAYVNAVTFGQNEGLDEVLDNDFKFSMLRGKSMISWNKSQTLEFMKTTDGVKQDCKTSIAINESNADMTIAKVTMKYPGFTRINYVTMTYGMDGWKITSVYSVFK